MWRIKEQDVVALQAARTPVLQPQADDWVADGPTIGDDGDGFAAADAKGDGGAADTRNSILRKFGEGDDPHAALGRPTTVRQANFDP
ncbi:MAG: hypothetical protein JNM61_01470 [Zoogloeaceae bacterium]|nr:hypothetical protein [Zoogloeaceae bacterium]